MKIKEDVMLREIAGTWLVIPTGARVVDFNGMMTLSDTGAFLWKQLEKKTDKNHLLAALLNEYDIDKETAMEDIDEFLKKLVTENLIYL